MKFKLDNLVVPFFAVVVLAVAFVYFFVEEPILPVQNGSLILTEVDEDTIPRVEVDPYGVTNDRLIGTIGIVFDYTGFVTRVTLADSTGTLTIFDPTIKVVWDTLTWRRNEN